MNTPTHMLVGAALFGRRDRPKVTLAAFAGGLAPDLPIVLMVLAATRLAGIPEHEVFETLYYSESWQGVFAVDHSLLVWTIFALTAWLLRLSALLAFAASGLAHAAIDFVTHNDDARRQFWPFSEWVFRSPISYWDPAYHGEIVSTVEVGITVALTAVLLVRLRRWWERVLSIVTAAFLLVPIALTGGFHGLHGMS